MLKDYTDDELQRELNAREANKRLADIPQAYNPIDVKSIIEFAESVRDDVVNGNYHEDNDNAQYAYETIMEAVFGRDYFTWQNKNTN